MRRLDVVCSNSNLKNDNQVQFICKFINPSFKIVI